MRKYNASRYGGRRACLGADGTYSIENCNGSIWAQGIGQIQREVVIAPNLIYVTTDDFIYVTSDDFIYVTDET